MVKLSVEIGPGGRPDAQAVLRLVRDAVVMVLELAPDQVAEDSAFVRDLHADSLALVEIVELVEEALAPLAAADFHIEDDDLEALVTVGDAVRYAVARL